MRLHRFTLVTFACLVSVLFHVPAGGADTVKRFVLAIGSNNGGPQRPNLRYAVSDAQSLVRVFRSLGGVEDDGAMLLADPRRSRIEASLDELRERAGRAKRTHRRVEIIFYYSGHSDEEGILPSGEKMLYRDIRKRVMDIPADVRIAVLDSCSSGAFTLAKGGKKRDPFLMDHSHAMRGVAFMTSSSRDEAAQESDSLGGSFFTHYLLTGLKGAADMVEDRRVTLNEAYQFAYAETLSRTAKTLRGAQHPNYHIMMSGSGDVVMTDLRTSACTLAISRGVAGRIFIKDGMRRIQAELTKSAGKTVRLGLDPGSYTVLNERPEGLFESRVMIPLGGEVVLAAGSFEKTEREFARARGDEQAEDQEAAAVTEPVFQKGGYADAWVRIGISAGGAAVMGGVIQRENRLVSIYRYDLSMAYLSFRRYSEMNASFHVGSEVEIMAPAVRFVQQRGFDLTALKFGLVGRYGYQLVEQMIYAENSDGGKDFSNSRSFRGALMRFNHWGVGPSLSLVFTPRNNLFSVMFRVYLTAGQVLGGSLSGGTALRAASLLWLRLAGLYGQPFIRLDSLAFFAHTGSLNRVSFKGYTVRAGIGPEICLHRAFPLFVGMRMTLAHSGLMLRRVPLMYWGRGKRINQLEPGAEACVGLYF